mmetsp:Transcript_6312/g.15629  ORF Transcript_6312/g.15629 Transcript_6312/m.15629 type:complete len:86 (+) Transcript_6312:203-460(+)
MPTIRIDCTKIFEQKEIQKEKQIRTHNKPQTTNLNNYPTYCNQHNTTHYSLLFAQQKPRSVCVVVYQAIVGFGHRLKLVFRIGFP